MRLFVLFSALLLPISAGAITLDFETEDDFLTPLVNGQIIDPAFDGVDLEFGNLVNISSTTIGSDGHIGVTVFDSDPAGPNSGSQDPDLLVDLGNILILQNDDSPASFTDGTYGERYSSPNDEASFNDRGAIVFDFLQASVLTSIDLIDINGNVESMLTLLDSGGKTRTYSVPMKWTTDVTALPNGYQTLFLNTLANQASEANATGGDATAVEDLGFDASQVIRLTVAFLGSSPSGGLDNLVFVPEPGVALLLLAALPLAGALRRR